MQIKPPHITPRKHHDESRLAELIGAITRSMNQWHKIPTEWVEEYNDVSKRCIQYECKHDMKLIRQDGLSEVTRCTKCGYTSLDY